MKVTREMLVGASTEHLVELQDELMVHRDIVEPLQQLTDVAASQGFELTVASGFRSFERQLAIWNAKASGERDLLDENGQPLDAAAMSETQRMWAILRWSALPGTSRHHWGSDIDIWDRGAVSADYRLQLTVQEYSEGGPFFPMQQWLQEHLEGNADEFYFPYRDYQGGVMPEPWHISYRPVANQFEQALTTIQVAEVIEQSNILLKQSILRNMEEIMARFVVVSH